MVAVCWCSVSGTGHAGRSCRQGDGVSRQCAHRWVARFDAEGEPGCTTGRRGRTACPTRTRAEVEAAVVRRSARASARAGLARPRARRAGPDGQPDPAPPRRAAAGECDPMTGEVIRASKTTAVRYERDRPGELVHMDVKKIGRIPDGGGWRAHGREHGLHRRPRTQAGSASTTSTPSSTTTAGSPTPRSSPTRRGATCAAFLARAAAYFAAHGITRIERVMTDNHWSYTRTADFADVIADARRRPHVHQAALPLAERQGRTLQPHPRRPNGPTGRSSPPTTTAPPHLAPWLEYYNTRRRHSALGGHPPISRLSPT